MNTPNLDKIEYEVEDHAESVYVNKPLEEKEFLEPMQQEFLEPKSKLKKVKNQDHAESVYVNPKP